jgi:hypothetical protein
VKHKQDSQKPAIPSGRQAFFREGFLKLTPQRKTRQSLTRKAVHDKRRDLRRALIQKCRLHVLTSNSGIALYIPFLLFFYLFSKHKQKIKERIIVDKDE